MQNVQGVLFGVLEWLFWTIALVSAGAALFRAEAVTSGDEPGVRSKSGLLTGLWVLAAVTAVAGFVTATLAMRAGAT